MNKVYIDLTGKRFGSLLVVKRDETAPKGKGKSAIWECQCDCGNKCFYKTYELKNGSRTACSECRKKLVDYSTRTKHGERRTRLYRIWEHIKGRCQNSNNDAYKYYGGRGITVCKEWQEFIPFRDWALANGYRDDLTIDRIDVNGNYEPSNCRWATRKEQANNRSTNCFLELDGKRKTFKEWEEITGIPAKSISLRNKRGWPIERILSEPVISRKSCYYNQTI